MCLGAVLNKSCFFSKRVALNRWPFIDDMVSSICAVIDLNNEAQFLTKIIFSFPVYSHVPMHTPTKEKMPLKAVRDEDSFGHNQTNSSAYGMLDYSHQHNLI